MVGWLAHESCSVTGEMFIALAGRVARAVIAETPGVYRPSWSIEDVGRTIWMPSETCDAPLIFPVVPDGHDEHIRLQLRDGHRSSREERSMASPTRTGRWPVCAWSISPRW